MVDYKAVIKSADMTDDMQQDAIETVVQAIQTETVHKDIAAFLKKEFDKKYGPTWHCIVGKNYGSYVTHESQHFLYFFLDDLAILLFKSA
jgi:dynein light chain LC8-type